MEPPHSLDSSRYRTIQALGEGGQGRVFLVDDRLEGSRAAVKVFSPTHSESLLRREFRTLAELRHPGVARALHFGTCEGPEGPVCFYSMEYHSGQTLDAYLRSIPRRSKRRRQDVVLGLFYQVAEALGYLHSRGIIHLDVKPRNIIVAQAAADDPPHPILIDFGLVRLPDSPKAPIRQGTAPYVAPELFEGASPTPSYDVYSLGVTFYEALTGELPFRCGTVSEYSHAHRERSPPPPPDPDLPPGIGDLLLRMLAKHPEHRFRSGEDVVRELNRIPDVVIPKRPAQYHEPAFVGREREAQEFEAWYSTADRWRKPLELHGGAGMGKSRWMEHIACEIELRKRDVLYIEAAQERDFASYLLDAARLFLTDFRASTEEALWLAVQRGKKLGVKQRALLESSGPEELRRSLVRSLARRTREFIAEGWFLIVDDVDQSGALTREWYLETGRCLASITSGTGVDAGAGGLIASFRDDIHDATMAASSSRIRIAMGPLSREAALALAPASLNSALASLPGKRVEEQRKELYDLSAGHPFYYLQGLLSIAREEGETRDIRDQLRAAVDSLKPESMRLLLLLCLAEQPLPAKASRKSLALNSKQLAFLILDLSHRGLISSSSRGARPIHESVVRATIEQASEDELREAHRSLARCFEADGNVIDATRHLFDASEQKPALALARGLLDSSETWHWAGDRKLRDVFERAADASSDKCLADAFLEARSDLLEIEGRFRDSLALRKKLVDSTPDREDSNVRLRRMRKLASAFHRAGEVDRALSLLDACLDFADASAGHEMLHAIAEKALLCHFRHQSEEALDLARRGIESWRKLGAARDRRNQQPAINLLGVLGQIHLRRFEGAAAISCLEEGVALANKSLSRTNASILLNNLGLAYHMAGRLAPALETFDAAAASAVELNDGPALLSVRCNQAQIHAKLGDFDAARSVLAEIRDLGIVEQSRRLRLSNLYTETLVRHLAGDARSCDWSEVEDLGREIGDEFLISLSRIFRAELCIEEGDAPRAIDILDRQKWPAPFRAARTARLALAHAELGDRKRAELTIERHESQQESSAVGLSDWNRFFVARALHLCHQPAAARENFRSAERSFRTSKLLAGRIECSLSLSDLALSDGDFEDAARWLENVRLLSFKARQGHDPRRSQLRLAVLQARLAVAAKEEPSRSREVGGKFSDLVARVAGDSQAMRSADLRLDVAALKCRQGFSSGNSVAARSTFLNWRWNLRERVRTLSPEARARYLQFQTRRFEQRAGQAMPRGRIRLLHRHAENLSLLLGSLTRSKSGALDVSILEQIARGCDALAARIRTAGRDSIEYRKITREHCIAPRSLMRHGESIGHIELAFAKGELLPGWTVAWIGACADVLALHVAPQLAEDVPATAVPESSRQVTRTLGRTETLNPQATRKLTRSEADGLRWVAKSPAMRRVLDDARRLASSDLPVLITGESGTGKDLLARWMHLESRRGKSAFVSQNCSSMPAELVEADLFGYQQGAFSGAEKDHTGFLFQANGGSFCFEEIGDADEKLQSSLLRMLAEKAVRPLGASDPCSFDVRFFATTQKDLKTLVEERTFRADLYYRLQGGELYVPPLRKRSEDIAPLVELFSRNIPEGPARVTAGALQRMERHDWPGNVRELMSLLRRLALRGSVIDSAAVEEALGAETKSEIFSETLFTQHSIEELNHALELAHLEHIYRSCDGDLDKMAERLKTTTRSVYRKFERFGVKPGHFESGDRSRKNRADR